LIRYLVLLTSPTGCAVSGRGLWPLACRDGRFKAHQGQGCASLASVVCCQQTSLQQADHSSRVLLYPVCHECNHEASTIRRPWPTRGCQTTKRKVPFFVLLQLLCSLISSLQTSPVSMCSSTMNEKNHNPCLCTVNINQNPNTFRQNSRLQVPTPLFIFCYYSVTLLLYCCVTAMLTL
jgi:hypothetical protein